MGPALLDRCCIHRHPRGLQHCPARGLHTLPPLASVSQATIGPLTETLWGGRRSVKGDIPPLGACAVEATLAQGEALPLGGLGSRNQGAEPSLGKGSDWMRETGPRRSRKWIGAGKGPAQAPEGLGN